MKTTTDLRDTLFVLFGAAGDLSQRLIVPALFNLYLDKRLPARFLLLGVDRTDYDDTSLAGRYREGVANFSRHGASPDDAWREFAGMIHYLRADVTDHAARSICASVTRRRFSVNHRPPTKRFCGT